MIKMETLRTEENNTIATNTARSIDLFDRTLSCYKNR